MKKQKKDQVKWVNLYSNHINNDFKNWDDYFKTKIKLKKSFLKYVIKYAEKTKKPILECGCGTGKTSIYLANIGLKSYAIDIEKEMVCQTLKNYKEMGEKGFLKVINGDIKNIPFENKFFSVTHSSGVMEHFSDDDIVKIINEQLRVSDFCIFSVPTSYFEKKMLGNERFMTRKEWRAIINNSNGIIIKESGYHYKKFKNRLIDIIKRPKRLLKPIALYTFIIKEEEKI